MSRVRFLVLKNKGLTDMGRMISLTPSADADAWSAWLEHHRGTKIELVMLSCARQGRAFKVWTRLPPERLASAGVTSRPVDTSQAPKLERPVVHDGVLDEIAARLEINAVRDEEEVAVRDKRIKTAERIKTRRERELIKVQIGDRPSIEKLPDLGTIEIFDPTEEQELRNGHRKVTKLKPRVKLTNLRDDPVGQMAKRDQITSTQLDAARRWQAWHDTAQLGSVRGIDPSNIAVDGGRFSEPISDVQRLAIKRLVRTDVKLGEVGAMLVRRVLGDRMTITQVGAILGDTSELGLKRLGWRVRECLDTLVHATGTVVEGPMSKTPKDDAAEIARYAGKPDLHRAVHGAKAKAEPEPYRAQANPNSKRARLDV